MSEVLETGVILSFNEFRVLLYGMGMRSIDGIYMEDEICTDEEVIRALQHMSEQGIIENVENEAFVLNEEIRRMLEIIGNPENTQIYRPGETQDGPEFYCYVTKEHIVVSERYWKKKAALKLRLFSAETFRIWKEQMDDDYRGG
ncbi:hypothetical protein [Frisingicoccus sp.]|uniref:hypothetical protein n=1 Tax=Frisingicoccus sp. TaxID=1918627 RepID=UPI003AB72A92